MKPKNAIRGLARAAGYEIKRIGDRPFYERRQRVLQGHGIAEVIDVGANVGQYATGLRSVGYTGRIASYEPVPSAFERLKGAAAADARWAVHNWALGAEDGDIPFNVSEDGVCSSALTPTEKLTNAIPDAATRATINVPVRRLDGLSMTEPFMLKIDTQGFERHVLDGAVGVMDLVQVLDLELAFTELYEGGSSAHELLPHLHQLGFVVHCVDEGFTDAATGRTLDADFLMVRR